MNPHSPPATSPLAMFRHLWRDRQLISKLTKRDVVGRYSGSMFGLLWSFFNPVLMLAVYTFTFSVIFSSRWGPSADESRVDYAILLFVGMIAHGLFAECVNRAPYLIITNANYVKKVIFPLEALPWTVLGSALFHALVSIGALLAMQLVLKQSLPWTVLLLPLVLLPLVLGTMGFSWLIASLGVYLRDIGQMTGIFTTALMFLSCVFYPASALPEKYQAWMRLNPLAYIINECREVLVFGRVPDIGPWVACTLGSLVVAWMGFAWFQRTRAGFADVI
jgi:lipopolysaccharide transport system permease protein